MTYEAKVRPWLLIVLAVVVVAGGIFTWWNVYRNKGATTTKTSPTPTTSAVSSPTASAGAKTATPTPGQTATPAATATPTPTSTPPAGWKQIDSRAVGSGDKGVSFSVDIKNEWQEYNRDDTAHGPVFFTSSNCNASPGENYPNCWNHLAISYYDFNATNPDMNWKTYDTNVGSIKVYVGINKSLSASDQNIIFNSFRVTAAN